ncbi:hypothetical protein C8Q78DRAFT_972559 [Trametes maxima]|nr:hypothetical protein C8Q78DRAFT_972559 [Trametes maxima]
MEHLEDPIPPTLRRAISLSSLAAGGKQRRKRSRTTPEQLAKLEEYFAADQSPTSARRRDIARELGLDERQTQIWFQNRRAKVKLQAKIKARAVERLEPPPRSPPPLASGFDAEVYNLLHEDEEVTIVPCTDLTIGTWRRVATEQHDLIAYTCDARRCITWFIRSSGLSFKMEIPFDSIADTRFANVSPGVGSATFILDRPPTFYVETLTDPALGAESPRAWQPSPDWTEARQASAILSHCLMGPAYQLSHLLTQISPSGTPSETSVFTPPPSVSEAGSSPEVYSRSCDSPVDPHPPPHPYPHGHSSTMVLRKPSSLSSLRMMHHPSLERLRPHRHASVPMFHSPLSSMSTPSSPHLRVNESSPMLLYLDGSGSRQYFAPQPAIPADSLPRVMPDLRGLHYDYCDPRSPASPQDYGSEPPMSAVSTPGYYGAPSPIYEMPCPSQGETEIVEERPQAPYYHFPYGFPGPVYDRGGGAC